MSRLRFSKSVSHPDEPLSCFQKYFNVWLQDMNKTTLNATMISEPERIPTEISHDFQETQRKSPKRKRAKKFGDFQGELNIYLIIRS